MLLHLSMIMFEDGLKAPAYAYEEKFWEGLFYFGELNSLGNLVKKGVNIAFPSRLDRAYALESYVFYVIILLFYKRS